MADRILVVEGFDEVDLYSRALTGAGFVVERARPDHALSIVRERPIGAVVAPARASADRDLVSRLRKARIDLPIIAVGDAEDLALELLCIAEPVMASVFVSLVRYLLQHVRMRRAWRDLPCEVAVSATDAKNEFASILETAVAHGPVCIQKHGEARAVLIGWDDYEKLTASPHLLDTLRDDYDARLARMQEPGMRARMQSAFDADSGELGAAAVSQARRGR